MESEYFWDMIWKIFCLVIVVYGTVRVAWRRIKEKRKLADLAMYATVEAEKQRLKKENKSTADS